MIAIAICLLAAFFVAIYLGGLYDKWRKLNGYTHAAGRGRKTLDHGPRYDSLVFGRRAGKKAPNSGRGMGEKEQWQ
jgi:hypothetical protein